MQNKLPNDERQKISYNICVSEKEKAILDKLEKEYGMSHTDFVKAALEEKAGFKIFRPRNQKYNSKSEV